MYLVVSAMVVFIGALDDKFDLKVRIRIVGQIIIASLMITNNANLLAVKPLIHLE
jgi:UDP-GlcNAc:undecaprenyl-phosphate GlcNAc-1-phosphate transferase